MLDMKRRDFIALVGGGGLLLATNARRARAQQPGMPVVGFLRDSTAAGSEYRPGGNLTGVAYLGSALGAKRLGLMHEMVPKVADFAVLAHPTYPASAPFISDVKAGARSMGLRIEVFNASTESEIDTAFAALSARRLGALLIANHPLFTTRRERIIALAARYAVPTMYVQREFASAGGLITYGTDLPEVYRLTGGYAGRILRGDKPADLPVLLPTKFEMIINLRTAKALGLDVPDKLLALADEVIE
jgi:putative ABC transport system substrate-binding protein